MSNISEGFLIITCIFIISGICIYVAEIQGRRNQRANLQKIAEALEFLDDATSSPKSRELKASLVSLAEEEAKEDKEKPVWPEDAGDEEEDEEEL